MQLLMSAVDIIVDYNRQRFGQAVYYRGGSRLVQQGKVVKNSGSVTPKDEDRT